MNLIEKRAACVGKRPKSREETPKEGSDSAKALPHRTNMRPRCTKRKCFWFIFGAKPAAPQSRRDLDFIS